MFNVQKNGLRAPVPQNKQVTYKLASDSSATLAEPWALSKPLMLESSLSFLKRLWQCMSTPNHWTFYFWQFSQHQHALVLIHSFPY